MSNISIGHMVLALILFLILFGLSQRVLDRMRLTNTQAVVILLLIIGGSFVDIPLWSGDIQVTLNVGGALTPLCLAVYLLVKAGTVRERVRAVVAAVLTAGIIHLTGAVLMTGDLYDRFALLDPLYVYPLAAGFIAYLLGRSRRASFVAAVFGVLLTDIIHWIWLIASRTPGNVHFGGAGGLDSVVLAAVFAVVLAELIGEFRERLQGGPVSEGRDPALLRELQKEGHHAEKK
jgi:uncharacterized membrane protein